MDMEPSSLLVKRLATTTPAAKGSSGEVRSFSTRTGSRQNTRHGIGRSPSLSLISVPFPLCSTRPILFFFSCSCLILLCDLNVLRSFIESLEENLFAYHTTTHPSEIPLPISSLLFRGGERRANESRRICFKPQGP